MLSVLILAAQLIVFVKSNNTGCLLKVHFSVFLSFFCLNYSRLVVWIIANAYLTDGRTMILPFRQFTAICHNVLKPYKWQKTKPLKKKEIGRPSHCEISTDVAESVCKLLRHCADIIRRTNWILPRFPSRDDWRVNNRYNVRTCLCLANVWTCCV